MVVNLIIEKLQLNPKEVLAKKIRGFAGFTTYELVFALINTASIKEASNLLGYSSDITVKRAIRSVLRPKFPDRTSIFSEGCKFPNWRYTLLKEVGYKHCYECERLLPFSNFGNHSGSDSTGLAGRCLSCSTANSKEYKLAIKLRTPKWADSRKIREIYNNCPDGYHVDHIVPLCGANVSGLHVEYNLQYLTAKDNIAKSNRFTS